MLKFVLFLAGGLFLGACIQQEVSPQNQIHLTTTVTPEVTVTIRNDSQYPVTVLATSAIGATLPTGVTRLPVAEVVIEAGDSFVINWGALEEAVAIAGNVDFLLNGEEFRLNATF